MISCRQTGINRHGTALRARHEITTPDLASPPGQCPGNARARVEPRPGRRRHLSCKPAHGCRGKGDLWCPGRTWSSRVSAKFSSEFAALAQSSAALSQSSATPAQSSPALTRRSAALTQRSATSAQRSAALTQSSAPLGQRSASPSQCSGASDQVRARHKITVPDWAREPSLAPWDRRRLAGPYSPQPRRCLPG